MPIASIAELTKSLTDAMRSTTEKPVVAEVKRFGDKITLPEGMTYEQAINVLNTRKSEDEQVVNVSQSFNCFPLDGAHALAQALNEKYGWFGMAKIPGGFFRPEVAPTLIRIESSPGVFVECPMGRFTVPNIPYEGTTAGWFSTTVVNIAGMPKLAITARIRRMYLQEFNDICERTHRFTHERSIYRGKAIRLNFDDNNTGTLDAIFEGERKMGDPKFLTLGPLTDADIILNNDVEESVRTNIWTPIERLTDLKRLGEDIKRATLLAGTFGVGKTMIAHATAAKCIANGVTFLLCDRADRFVDCVHFASSYMPALVFCEDIDRSFEGRERDTSMDEILNTIDGIESKRTELQFVLTTNRVERIHRAMLRPGRLDAIIEVTVPNSSSVRRLLHRYLGSSIAANTDLAAVCEKLSGQIPAVIAEVAKRSKLAAIKRAPVGISASDLSITTDALNEAADSMNMQLRLLSSTNTSTDTNTIGSIVANHIGRAIDGIRADVQRGPALPSPADGISVAGN